MEQFGRIVEQFKVQGMDLAAKVKELIHEGNVRRIVIKDEKGHTFMEIPLTVATAAVVLAPLLTALGAFATVVSHFNIEVERNAPAGSSAPPKTAASAQSHAPGGPHGATEEQMNMAGTVPQHMDNRGTKSEDIAGTGGHDSQGG